MKEKKNKASNAKDITGEFPALEQLNATIKFMAATNTKNFVADLCAAVDLAKAKVERLRAELPKGDPELTKENEWYNNLLVSTNDQLRIICKMNGVTDTVLRGATVNKNTGKPMSAGWLSEWNEPPGTSRARSVETSQRRNYTIIQARKNALFALFASRTWAGVDADKFVQGVRTGELKM